MANKIGISAKLKRTASAFPVPLYLVGGCVRNALLGVPESDRDICSALPVEDAARILEGEGYRVTAVYPRLGTLKLRDGETGEELEYTRFRTERYGKGGGHTPDEVRFTGDIAEDARRRDFKMNAIYWEIAAGNVVDPLGGLGDLRAGRVTCADDPERVFGSDGLRLLRLVRFCAELNLSPDAGTLEAARSCRDNLGGIVRERVAEEFRKICFADLRYPSLTGAGVRLEIGLPFGEGGGSLLERDRAHAAGLLFLDRLGLLEKIVPEITAGKGCPQRTDYHRYDVFGHTAETFRLSPPEIRIAALLHDVGKPAVYAETGRYLGHDRAGAAMAQEICLRALGLSARESAEVARLVDLHMFDLDGRTRESKRKRFLVKNFDLAPKLIALRQTDFLGGGLGKGPCPTACRWQNLLDQMKKLHTPVSLSDLAVSGKDVADLRPDLPKTEIKHVLAALWDRCILDESLNCREKLLPMIERYGGGTEKRTASARPAPGPLDSE